MAKNIVCTLKHFISITLLVLSWFKQDCLEKHYYCPNFTYWEGEPKTASN